MNAAIAVLGNTASALLAHLFGTGLADERYVVERLRAHADGDIRPWPGKAPAKPRKGGANKDLSFMDRRFAPTILACPIRQLQGVGMRLK